MFHIFHISALKHTDKDYVKPKSKLVFTYFYIGMLAGFFRRDEPPVIPTLKNAYKRLVDSTAHSLSPHNLPAWGCVATAPYWPNR